MRTKYAQTTQEKMKDNRSVEDIFKAYDNGELAVPCVQIQCVGFDNELYQAMVAESKKWKKSSSTSSLKRGLDYEADDDCARKRRTTKRVHP